MKKIWYSIKEVGESKYLLREPSADTGEAESIAEECAERFWQRGGRSYKWPLTFNLYWEKDDENPYCTVEVSIKYVPHFHGTKKSGMQLKKK